MTQLLLDLKPEQSPTLENFVAGGNGELTSRLATLARDQLLPFRIHGRKSPLAFRHEPFSSSRTD